MNAATNESSTRLAWPNPERRIAKGAVWVTVLAVMGIFAPGLLGIDGMDGGFAISFLAFFIAICGLVVALMFRRRAAEVDRLLAGNELLAHWEYPAEPWHQYVADETIARHGANRSIVWLVAVWAIPIGLLFWLFDHEGGLVVMLVMIGLCLLMAAVGWGLPLIWQRRRRTRPTQTWIGERAAFFDNVLFRWDGFGNRLDQVTLHPAADQTPPLLHLHLSSLSRVGWQPYDLRMPVPEDKWLEAQELAHTLSRQVYKA